MHLVWPARPIPLSILYAEVYIKGEGSSNSCHIGVVISLN